MDLESILDQLNRNTAEELRLKEDEDFKKFVKGAMEVSQARALPSRGSVSSGSYEEDMRKLRGHADDEPEEPNKNGDIFKNAGVLGQAYAQGIVSKKSVLEELMSKMSMNADTYYKGTAKDSDVQGGSIMAAPVRPQMWTGSKPSFEREHDLEQQEAFCREVVFGPFPGDKTEDTVEKLKHLLTQAQANRAQADERPCKKPCRFLKESVRDSEVSGVPVGVRQRCAHPVFEQKAMYGLLSVYAQILNVTEKFCESLVKSNPDVLDALPTARKLALATSQSLLITPRENNRDLIVSYLTDLDFLRTKVASVIDEMKKNHALTVSDDRYFTHEEPISASTNGR
jgi:hypothetical protein